MKEAEERKRAIRGWLDEHKQMGYDEEAGQVIPDPSGEFFRALFDLKEIQEIQDAFAEATGVASIITTTEGQPITEASNFCQLCKSIIRKTEKGLSNCFKSDAAIGRYNPEGPIVQPCLSGGLWDAGASITAGHIHIGNWLIGQVRDQNTDAGKMADYAREIGADVDSFMEAFEDVTQMPREQFEAVARALFMVANQMSQRAFQNLQQARLLADRDRLNQIINRSDLVVFHWKNEKDWPVLFASDNVEALTGYTADDFKSGRVLYSDVVHPEDLAQIENEAERLTSDPSALEINHQPYRILHRSGMVKWVQDNTILIRNKHGACYEAQGLVVDISEKHTHELQRMELEKQLERAEKMELVGAVAGGVAHDLNNILGAIVSYPDLLLRKISKDNPMYSRLELMQKAGQRAADIVQELLTLTRRSVVAKEVIHLGKLIEDYMDSPEFRELSESHAHIRTHFSIDPGLLNIEASQTHIMKCTMNLVHNAFESIDPDTEGNVTVAVASRYVDTAIRGYDDVVEGEYVTLRVTDNGVGIAPEDQERICEPFYTTKQMGRSGTGLGMAVVWNVVKDHKGYLTIDSTVGKGASFTVYFPCSRQALPTEEASWEEQWHGKGEHVLVVDDAEVQRALAQSLLSESGYEVETVASGEEAVEYVRERPVDILVLDMIMDPGIDGLETYRRILEIRPGQKAVIASGYSETSRVREAQRLGAGQYLKKPYRANILCKALKEELAV